MIKANEKVTSGISADLKAKEQDFEASRLIGSLKEHEGWIVLRSILDTNLKRTEIALKDFEKLTDKGRDFLLKQRADLMDFMSYVDDSEEHQSALLSEIAELKSKLDERANKRPSRPTAP